MSQIQKAEAKTLSAQDLKGMLGGTAAKVRFMQYDELKNIKSLTELLSGKIAAIILLQIESPNAPPVGHWITMMDRGAEFEHFDPYGFSIDKELSITHEQPWLKMLAQRASKSVRESRHRYQAVREDVNTCGRWCVFRILKIQLNDEQFQEIFRNNHLDPDAAVTQFTSSSHL